MKLDETQSLVLCHKVRELSFLSWKLLSWRQWMVPWCHDVVVSTAVKSFTRNMYVLPILMVIAQ